MYRVIPRLFLFFLVTGFAVVMAREVLSQSHNKFAAVTPFEVMAIFYKMAGVEPDFLDLAEKSDAYTQAKAFDRDAIRIQERIRLQEVFYNTFPDQLVSVHVRLNKLEYSDLQKAFFVPEFSSATFFSYPIFDHNFVIIPQNIEYFHRWNIVPAHAHAIKQRENQGGFLVELRIMPIRADTSGTIKIADTHRWMLLGRIEELHLWDNEQEILLWSMFSNGEYSKQQTLDISQ